jgi:hypothetical protein
MCILAWYTFPLLSSCGLCVVTPCNEHRGSKIFRNTGTTPLKGVTTQRTATWSFIVKDWGNKVIRNIGYPATSPHGVTALKTTIWIFTRKMEAVRWCETLVSYITTQRHNPEVHNVNFHPEDGNRKVLRNIITPFHHTASHPRRSWPESSPWSPETLVSYNIMRCHNPEDYDVKFHPEDGSRKVLRNVITPPHHHTASEPRRPPQTPQISQISIPLSLS